jgi:hypothetical protein
MVAAQGQALFVWRFFPSHWPDFWGFLFSHPDVDFVKYFLWAFSVELAAVTPGSLPAISAMKQRLIDIGVAQQIERHVLQGVGEGDRVAFMTLPSLARWSDSEWQSDPEWISVILRGMGQPEVVQFAADALRVIMRRPIDASFKVELIVGQCCPERISELTGQHRGSVAILASLAKLIVQIGFVLVKWGDAVDFFQLALNYLTLQDEVTLHVLPFLGRYVSAVGGDACRRCVRALIDRITVSIDGFTDTVRLVQALDQIAAYSQVISIASAERTADVIEEIEALAVGEKPVRLFGALVAATHWVVKAHYYARIGQFLPAFLTLLEWALPLSPAQILCVALAYDFFSDYPDRFGVEHIPVLLAYLANLATAVEIPRFSFLLAKFAQSAARHARRHSLITADIVATFVATRRPDFLLAAGHLTGALADSECSLAIERAGTKLLAVSSRASCELALIFMTGLRRDAACGAALPLFRNLQPACVGDPDLLALVVRAGAALLGPGVQGLICDIAEILIEPSVIASACTALAITLKPECVAPRASGQTSPCALLPLVPVFLSAAADDAVALALLDFAGALFALVHAPPEIVQPVCELARRITDSRFDSPVALRACAAFVSGLARCWPEVAEDAFTGALLNGVFADGFSPLSAQWETYTEKVHAVHQSLLRVDPDGFGGVFVAAVAGIGAGEDFAQKYLLKGESLSGARKHTKCRGLFQELLELFWAMPL